MRSWQKLKHAISQGNRENLDILEYAVLTSKFWKVYKENENHIRSVEHLEATFRGEQPDSRNDLLFILVFEKDEIPYGFATIRGSWKNTLKIEYLFKNPTLLEN